MKLNLIIASDEKNGIWKNNTLPWHIPEDLKYFAKITSTTKNAEKINALIMWRKTWDSIPSKFKPFKNRINCILTKKKNKTNSLNVFYFNSFEACISDLNQKNDIEQIFIIWWAELYNYTLENDKIDKIYLTKINWDYNCDTFFSGIPENFKLKNSKKAKEYKFEIYEKIM